jgi:Fe2+ or Zn2+ uptake regulation protein
MDHRTPKDPIERLFLSHKLRCTRQRVSLYKALAATKSHPTAEQIFRDLLPRSANMSLATVYNSLEALCRAGLVQKLSGSDGSARFDACVADHLHLFNLETGDMRDAPDHVSQEFFKALPRRLLEQIEEKTGLKVRQVQVVLSGTRNGN